MRKSASGFFNKVTPRKLIRKTVSKQDLRSLSEKVSLERVLGLTTTNSNGIACNPVTGVIAYPAGCVIVLYDPKSDQQKHIINQEKKTITCVNFSGDGKYLASGECGQQPMVRVWELGDTITQISELKGHKSGIISVEFSPNQKLLISIGDQHDMLVNIWNWKGGHTVACNKSGCRVRSVSISENGQYLVTVGNRHVKFWYLNSETPSAQNVPIAPITGRSGILGDQRNNCFTDVMCGRGKNSSFTYCVTKSGLLCLFSEKRILDKWVQLKAGCTNCLVVTEKYIYCGCSDGIVRVFNPNELKFLATLPLPHKLGINVCGNAKNQADIAVEHKNYADVVALAVDEHRFILSSVYNDHSLYIWNIRDIHNVHKLSSFLYHSACIWGVETYSCFGEDSCLPYGSFLTCSSDDTIRIWNMDKESNENNVYFKNVYSKELLKIVYIDEGLSNLQDTSMTPLGKDTDSKNGVRCMQISPSGLLCAAGDRSGNLRIYNLKFFDEIFRIDAHESEILCVEFSDPKSGFELLATSSRDRLVHIFDVQNKFNLLQTIDDHSSSITAVRFNYDLDVLQLLSCGADKVVMFHTGQTNANGSITFVRNTIVPGKSTLYDMGIDPTRKLAATVGQDRNMRVYDIQGAKQVQCFKGSPNEGNLIKLQLDPSGVYAAISCSDKTISLYDFSRGECETVILGHSELVTGLKFTSDGKRLISVSGDGCIFIWTLPTAITDNILNRLDELEIPYIPRGSYPNETIDAHRKTFIISSPKLPDDDSSFKTPPKDHSIHYRFSVGQLPVWARKQIGLENGSGNFKGNNVPLGRWGERTEETLTTVLEIENKTVTFSTSSVESNGVIGEGSKELKLSDDSLNGDCERTFEVTESQPLSSGWKKAAGVHTDKADSESESAESLNEHANSEAADDSFLESDYEDDAFSPLSEHFEKLGTPIVSKEITKPNYTKNLFHRASISAKFLSRSQKAARTHSVSTNEQRRRLEILKARYNNKTNTNISSNLKSSMECIIPKENSSRSSIQQSKLFKSCQNISQSHSDKMFHRLLSSPSFSDNVCKADPPSSTPWRSLDSKDLKFNSKQNAWGRSSIGKSPVKSFDGGGLSVDVNNAESVILRKKGDNPRRNRPRSMFVQSLSQKELNETIPHCLSDTETDDNIEIVPENLLSNTVTFQSVNPLNINNSLCHHNSPSPICDRKLFPNEQHSSAIESVETVYWEYEHFPKSTTERNGVAESLESEFVKDQNLSRVAAEINANIRILNLKSNYDDSTNNGSDELIVKNVAWPEIIRSDSPPQRDTVLSVETTLSKNSLEEDDLVSLASCQNLLHTFVKSYNDVRQMQYKVMEQTSSPLHSQLVSLISKTYLALGNSISEQREKLLEHLDFVEHQQDLVKSDSFQALQNELLSSNKDSSSVLSLLEKYSNLLLEVATTKIEGKLLTEV